MPLFQRSVIDKYLKTIEKQSVQAAYSVFKSHFHNLGIQGNIRNSKEEQYQGEFLIDLFVKVLGFTKNPTPNFNLTTEYKNVKDSKKADGAIVFNGSVKAVIELKGTNTIDLGNVEAQAFGYKNNQPECVYVITSNFEKLRFYIDNAIEFLEFNLFTLTENDFELLYLCLSYKSIEKGIPKKIKDESISHEDRITKQLYQDYSLFKRQLHQDLVTNNPQYDAITLFKKSQKLLDRFLFLFFAEDRQLLPPNSVRLILTDWRELQERDVQIPLYDRYKKYFEYLNTGFKGKRYDVFAYNGGLFKPDEILDSVKIDDELLHKHTLKLSDYDFESEVDVNILGHIFENSLNELDELKAQIEGTGKLTGVSKRKKDGVFYTPKYITKYIVDNTVGRLCNEKKAEFGIVEEDFYSDKKRAIKTKQTLLDRLNTYREWLLQISICDPACGSGAFLNQALDFLISEHQYIDELQAKIFGGSIVFSDVEKSILENNLFGVDLNEESVEIAKLSLWLRTAQPNRKLNDLNNNIKCGNSLIDDPAIAGEKAFNWEREFPQVFGRQETEQDINIEKEEKPDYLKLVQEKLIASQTKAEQALELSKEALEMSKQAYEYVEKLEKVSEPKQKYPSKKAGFDVVIGNPPYLNMTKGNTELKDLEFYANNYDSIKNANSKNIFTLFNELSVRIVKKNGLVSFIIPEGFLKTRSYEDCVTKMVQDGKITKAVYFENWVFEEATTGSVIFEYTKDTNSKLEFQEFLMNKEQLISKIERKTNTFLERYEKINFPLLSDICDVFKGMAVQDRTKFIFKNSSELPNKFLLGNCIDRYFFKDEYYCDYEKLTIVGGTKNKAKHDISPRILIRRTGNYLCCVLLEHPALTESTLYSCSTKDANFDIYYLLTILNSKLLTYIVRQNMITNEQAFPQILMTDIQLLKIPRIELDEQITFKNIGIKILHLNKDLQAASQKFQRAIQRDFELENLSTKLQNWYTLTFKEFIAELSKKKIKLTKKDEYEWEDLFLQEQKKAMEIKTQIDSNDREIDRMVYALYELTVEEIKIVEES